MGGLTATIKKFATNKTTVTIIGVVAGLAVLVGFYLYRVETTLSPVRIPIAKRTIGATNEITKDDIEYINVASSFLEKLDIYQDENELIGLYVTTGTTIAQGGMFYKDQLVEKKELPNAIFDKIPNNYTIYQLAVDNTSTYGNKIYPDDKIDLWLQTTDGDKLVFCEFIKDIEVLAVRDATGENVFDAASEGIPAWLLFAVPTEMYRYLKLTEFINGMEVEPVPSNKKLVTGNGTTEYSQKELIDMIKDQSLEVGR